MSITTDVVAPSVAVDQGQAPHSVRVNTAALERVQAVKASLASGYGKSGRGFGKLCVTETRVWLRGSDVFWVVFPALLLVVFGILNPENRMPLEGGSEHIFYGTPLYGVYALNILIPPFIAMAIGMTCISILPVTFGYFRDKGMIKRISATPMSSYGLFAAHYGIVIVMGLISAALAVAAVAVIVPLHVPQNVMIVLAGIILGMMSMLAVGSIVSALVKTAKSGTTWGNLIYFPLMFTAGVFTDVQPGGIVYHIGRVNPMGAASQVMSYGWFGGDSLPWIQMLVMVAWTLVLVPLSAKLFRWQ